jgi:curved DNA-binding protein
MNDHYQTLGVSRDATENDIKSAYRKMAMKHHPDRGGDINEFQRIQEAYDTLGDPQKKSSYDNPAASQDGFQFDFGNGFPQGFEAFFGQGSPFEQMFRFNRRAPQNQNIQVSTSISLEDAFFGKDLIASITLPSGTEQAINIKIPQGLHEGTTLRLSGIGDDSLPNAPRGDILLTVHIHEHPVYKRSGDDLIQELEVSCIDAMLGKKITITTLDQKQLQTEIPAGIQHDSLINLSGYGMPNFNDPLRKGRLLLKVKIKVPSLSADQKNKLQELNL